MKCEERRKTGLMEKTTKIVIPDRIKSKIEQKL